MIWQIIIDFLKLSEKEKNLKKIKRITLFISYCLSL